MRNAMLAILALSAATVGTVAGSSPAAAYDYPYCLQGRGVGIPASAPTAPITSAWRRRPDGRPTAISIRALPSESSGGCGFIGIIDRAREFFPGWPD